MERERERERERDGDNDDDGVFTSIMGQKDPWDPKELGKKYSPCLSWVRNKILPAPKLLKWKSVLIKFMLP